MCFKELNLVGENNESYPGGHKDLQTKDQQMFHCLGEQVQFEPSDAKDAVEKATRKYNS